MSAPDLVSSPHNWSVHILPVERARTSRSHRTSTRVALDSSQLVPCREDEQTTGNNNLYFQLGLITLRYL